MRLATAHIRDFKRFTDLRIAGLPAQTRMVLLVGPNGSGKTSLFEAFNYWIMQQKGSVNYDPVYHLKTGGAPAANWHEMLQRITLTFHDTQSDPRTNPELARKLFYFRSAYRHEADFTLGALQRANEILADSNRPMTLINPETRVSDNYQRIVSRSVHALFDPTQQSQTAEQITSVLVGRIRESMQRVFEGLSLSGLGRPMEGGTFFFDKGASKGYHYKNLSGGEKAAFDLLLDFIVKAEAFDETIFCIDEPELHMHTRLQARLLDELYKQLPQKCQLWLSTHSIGMTRRAMELHRLSSNEVVFLDFSGHEFDQAIELRPATVNTKFWRDMFRVALDDLAELVAPAQLIFCEGRKEIGSSARNPSFDAYVYRQIFGAAHADTDFVALGGTNQIEKDAALIEGVLASMLPKMKMWKVFDRDDRNATEIQDLKVQGIRVLGRRDLESYLWDDEVISKLADSVGKSMAAPAVLAEKQRLLASLPGRGKPADDVKAIAGELYNFTKIKLQLVGQGNNAVAFARGTLAPLVTRDTAVYSELHADVFGP